MRSVKKKRHAAVRCATPVSARAAIMSMSTKAVETMARVPERSTGRCGVTDTVSTAMSAVTAALTVTAIPRISSSFKVSCKILSNVQQSV